MIRLVVDSTFDFSDEFIRNHPIDVVPLTVLFGTQAYREKIDLTTEEFYAKLAASSELPKTSQPAPQTFLQTFEQAALNHDKLIVMTLSSGLSGTYQSACLAANLFSDAQIEIIDTKNATIGAQVQALEVLRMIQSGMEFEAIVQQARENTKKVRMIALINTLENLIKGGRLSKVEGMVGSLIAIKPLITIDEEGKIATLSKSRGLRKGISTMLAAMKEDEIDVSKAMITGYTGSNEALNQFMSVCDVENFHAEASVSLGAVIGTHAGSNGFACAYFVK